MCASDEEQKEINRTKEKNRNMYRLLIHLRCSYDWLVCFTCRKTTSADDVNNKQLAKRIWYQFHAKCWMVFCISRCNVNRHTAQIKCVCVCVQTCVFTKKAYTLDFLQLNISIDVQLRKFELLCRYLFACRLAYLLLRPRLLPVYVLRKSIFKIQ